MNTTIDTTKNEERRIRKAARDKGLRLEKSRSRNPMAPDYGTYAVIEGPADRYNWRSRTLVAGDINNGYGLSLEEAAKVIRCQ